MRHYGCFMQNAQINGRRRDAAGLPATPSAIRSQLLEMVLAPGADVEVVRRRALRSALRWWRSAVDPAQVSLPVRARRRPGLTRADVAELAELSLCWYTLLETGSKRHTCSPRAIDRVADALRLEEVDRAILHILASRESLRSLQVLFADHLELAA